LIPYPNISPVIFKLGPIQVRWYGMMYLLGFAAGYFILRRLTSRAGGRFKGPLIADFLAYAAIGIVAGGRIGYVIFYNLSYYLQHPMEVLAVWHGGLSFHGGFVGVIIAGLIFLKRNGLGFYEVADKVVVPVPVGLGLGRIGNFINGELVGRPTDLPWCMVFSPGDVCRHPSQLYEAVLEGGLLFAVMWTLGRGERPKGVVFWSFVGLYGFLRFLVEFFRQPDPQLGLVLGPFSMGQLLSLPMAVLGGVMVWRSMKINTKGQMAI
jgi:phosphatidylglycerol:prolipoprotein diacylglycerol transferase